MSDPSEKKETPIHRKARYEDVAGRSFKLESYANLKIDVIAELNQAMFHPSMKIFLINESKRDDPHAGQMELDIANSCQDVDRIFQSYEDKYGLNDKQVKDIHNWALMKYGCRKLKKCASFYVKDNREGAIAFYPTQPVDELFKGKIVNLCEDQDINVDGDEFVIKGNIDMRVKINNFVPLEVYDEDGEGNKYNAKQITSLNELGNHLKKKWF